MASEILANIGSGNGFVVWRLQAITLRNDDLSSTRFSGIHSKVICICILKVPAVKLILKVAHFKPQPDLPGDNELRRLTPNGPFEYLS